jgi:hypothetical protein
MGRSLRSAPASRSRLSTKLNDDQTQLYWRLAIIEVLALLRTSRAAEQLSMFYSVCFQI